MHLKKVFSAHLLSHPGSARSGTPEGGTSLTEGVALGADSREGVAPPVEREEPPLPFQPPKKKLPSFGPCPLAGMLSVEILL